MSASRGGKKKFRKGMKVCSIYEPDRVFVIDKSLLPGRVFHEKGATRWYTKRELRPANSRVSPTPQAKAGTLLHERSRGLRALFLIGRRRKFTCAECGTRFERKPKARPLKPGELPFCKSSCRTKHWKRQNRIQKQKQLRQPRQRRAMPLKFRFRLAPSREQAVAVRAVS